MITRVLLSRRDLTPKLIQYDLYNANGWETYGSFPYTIRTDEQAMREAKSRWPEAEINVHCGLQAVAYPVGEDCTFLKCQWGGTHWNNRG